MLAHVRRALDDRLAALDLAVEHPQWVALQPPLAVLADLIQMLLVVGHQMLDVDGLAGRAAGGVELKGQPPRAQCLVQIPGHGHDLQIHGRVLLADGLHVDLVELAVAARLGRFVAEGRADGIDFHRLRPGVHAMFDVGAHDAGGELRPQGQLPLTAVGEGVHLLLHDVGGLAHTAHEQGRFLEKGRLEAAVAVATAEVVDGVLQVSPVGGILGQNVLRATDSSVHRFSPSVARQNYSAFCAPCPFRETGRWRHERTCPVRELAI